MKWLVLAMAPLAMGAAVRTGPFPQQVRTFYTTAEGLPDNDVREVFVGADGGLYAVTAKGAARFEGGRWKAVEREPGRKPASAPAFPDRREEGLPYDEFTCSATAGDGSAWFGTRIGAIHRTRTGWEYRQGKRWLPGDEVRSITVTPEGVWFATGGGISRIAERPMTLEAKAQFFEAEIDKRHRRTEYGYVEGVSVAKAGDASEWTQHDSDNDGLWTAMYGAGECFACAATRSEAACRRAKAAFEALRFLGAVTQGGGHPAPRGFVARSILPANGANPNLRDSPGRDRERRATSDPLWKILEPRWPLSADGKWYWKSDTSSDELDGHYFFYALYYDLVAKTEQERRRVREQVAAMTDHLIDHGFQLVDHDGKVTRWGVFNPERLNHDPAWWEERSLNSISILSYLKVAAHLTGDARYENAARMLRDRDSYDMNTLIPKNHAGMGAGNQSDDEMAFMCLYNLMRYETDPRLRGMYATALRNRWEIEEPELNPLFDFIAAAALKLPEDRWLEDSAETLRRYPLDRFNWSVKNSHRKDVVLLPEFVREGRNRGHLRNGRVLPIDERYVDHWNHDPWQLDQGGDGRHLADGASFLLPYYMGLYHGFLAE
jgi:hypothetical protein